MVLRRSIFADFLIEISQPKYKYFGNIYIPLIIFYRSIIDKCGMFVCEPLIMRRPNMRSENYAKFEKDESALKWFTGDRYVALSALVEYGYDEKVIKNILKSSIVSKIFNGIIVRSAQRGKMILVGELKNYKLMPVLDKLIYAIFDLLPYS